MGETKGRFALVSTYAHLSRNSMERMLTAGFPEFEVENFSVDEVVKRNWRWIVPNMWYVAREFGRKLVRRQITLRPAYFWTTHNFVRVHAAMRQLIQPGRHLFSFQMQSLYNTSVPGVPHFVYTDHTHLSNLNYPDFDRQELREIFNLYGRKVVSGEWRDYAIDFLKDRAVFSVFRRASEMPLYRIVKDPALARRQGVYAVITATGLIVKRGQDLRNVLHVLEKPLRLVS